MILHLRSAMAAEFMGTAALTCVVVGSGRMATGLTRDLGTALLLNDVATVLALGLLIWMLGPMSGAHFNPVVSMVMRIQGSLTSTAALGYVSAQVAGAVAGTCVANLLYDQPAISVSSTTRGGMGQILAEVLATAGLLAIICIASARGVGHMCAVLVPAWIGSAYLFTSSTSFANPAVTVGRIFSDSFAGIAPGSVSGFIIAQVLGAFFGLALARAFTRQSKETVDV